MMSALHVVSDFFSQSTTVDWTIRDFLTLPGNAQVLSEVFNASFADDLKFSFYAQKGTKKSSSHCVSFYVRCSGTINGTIQIDYKLCFVNQDGAENNEESAKKRLTSEMLSVDGICICMFATEEVVMSNLIAGSVKLRFSWTFPEAGEFFAPANGLMSRLKNFYAMVDNSSTDFEIITEEGTVRVHKTMLKDLWPHFATMVDTPMEESTSGKWDIEGHSYDTMRAIVVYMYTGMVAFQSCGVAFSVLTGAQQYFIHDLEDICLKHISSYLRVENIFGALALAYFLDIQKLKDICHQRIISAKKESPSAYKKLHDFPDYSEFATDEMNDQLCDTFLNTIHKCAKK